MTCGIPSIDKNWEYMKINELEERIEKLERRLFYLITKRVKDERSK